MKAVMLEVPPALLEERRAKGLDVFDEMWEGVLHMVPPASGAHQRFGTALLRILAPLAEARGLVPSYETGVFRADDDYRVPDQAYSRPEHLSERGIDGPPELVIEILSPRDETYEKLEWYGRLGVREVLVLHPETRAAEVFAGERGRMVTVTAGPEGELTLETVRVRLRTVDGPLLRVAWEGDQADI